MVTRGQLDISARLLNGRHSVHPALSSRCTVSSHASLPEAVHSNLLRKSVTRPATVWGCLLGSAAASSGSLSRPGHPTGLGSLTMGVLLRRGQRGGAR
jgi:hypothetical protein